MPIVATVTLDWLDMAVLLLTVGGAGARQEHSISGKTKRRWIHPPLMFAGGRPRHAFRPRGRTAARLHLIL
jgi:hypothetical protein